MLDTSPAVRGTFTEVARAANESREQDEPNRVVGASVHRFGDAVSEVVLTELEDAQQANFNQEKTHPAEDQLPDLGGVELHVIFGEKRQAQRVHGLEVVKAEPQKQNEERLNDPANSDRGLVAVQPEHAVAHKRGNSLAHQERNQFRHFEHKLPQADSGNSRFVFHSKLTRLGLKVGLTDDNSAALDLQRVV